MSYEDAPASSIIKGDVCKAEEEEKEEENGVDELIWKGLVEGYENNDVVLKPGKLPPLPPPPPPAVERLDFCEEAVEGLRSSSATLSYLTESEVWR